MASVSPFLTSKETSVSASCAVSGYLNETLRNDMVPASCSGVSVTSPSVIVGSVNMTSSIRLAATNARGRTMKMMMSIMNAIMSCIA